MTKTIACLFNNSMAEIITIAACLTKGFKVKKVGLVCYITGEWEKPDEDDIEKAADWYCWQE